MQTPLLSHWDAAIRVVRYLKGCPAKGIMLRADSEISLIAYYDSDWSYSTISKCVCCLFRLLSNSWKTKKQHIVSNSSAEAEYRAMAYTLYEIKWLRELLHSFGFCHTRPIQLFCDSKAAIHIASNPVFHERTKHIEFDYHQVRDAVQDKLITT